MIAVKCISINFSILHKNVQSNYFTLLFETWNKKENKFIDY